MLDPPAAGLRIPNRFGIATGARHAQDMSQRANGEEPATGGWPLKEDVRLIGSRKTCLAAFVHGAVVPVRRVGKRLLGSVLSWKEQIKLIADLFGAGNLLHASRPQAPMAFLL